MGNCLDPERPHSSKRPPSRGPELTNLDRHSAVGRSNGDLQLQRFLQEVQPQYPPHVYPPHAYPQMVPPVYGVPVPVGYPVDPYMSYYHGTGPLLLLDPYTGMTYAVDEAMYNSYLEEDRRRRRRKEKKSSSKNNDEDEEDEDTDSDNEDVKEDVKNEQRRKPSNQKPVPRETEEQEVHVDIEDDSVENEVPMTSAFVAVTSTQLASVFVDVPSTPPTSASVDVTSTPPTSASVDVTSTPPTSAFVDVTSTPPTSASVDVTSTPLASAFVDVTSTPPMSANADVTSAPPTSANVDVTSTPPTSASVDVTSTHVDVTSTHVEVTSTHAGVTSTPPTPANVEVTSTSLGSAGVDVTSAPTPKRPANYQPRDVMISYSRSDTEIMQQIKDKLEAEGITVWVDVSSIDAGADFLSKIGEAIIDAKMLVCILSAQAVKSRCYRDEVALAYVSNTAIYPVNLLPREHLLPLMDTGLKLQLANYNWTSLTDPDTQSDNIDRLVSAMKAELDDLHHLMEEDVPDSAHVDTSLAADGGEDMTSPDDVSLTNGEPNPEPLTSSEHKVLSLRERNRAVTSLEEGDNKVMPEEFWMNHCGITDRIGWVRFWNAFLEEFHEPLKQTFTPEDQDQLMDILKRELEVDTEDRLFKYQFITFCSPNGQALPVWQCVRDQARETFAMREVFNMDSSVRVEAIENLGKFRSAAVIDALRDLLTDPDANVRAVAGVSLSRTDANDPVTLRHMLRMLNDKDQLVREAGCLALGHLKVKQATSKLTHLWQNDVISHVREAAAAALREIGGEGVEDVMRVTKVPAEEIRSLTETGTSL